MTLLLLPYVTLLRRQSSLVFFDCLFLFWTQTRFQYVYVHVPESSFICWRGTVQLIRLCQLRDLFNPSSLSGKAEVSWAYTVFILTFLNISDLILLMFGFRLLVFAFSSVIMLLWYWPQFSRTALKGSLFLKSLITLTGKLKLIF